MTITIRLSEACGVPCDRRGFDSRGGVVRRPR